MVESQHFDVIEPKGAEVLGRIVSLDQDYPIMTSHRYGTGRAIYLGLPVPSELLDPLLDHLIGELSIKRGAATPAGVIAPQIDGQHVLYLNLDREPRWLNSPATRAAFCGTEIIQANLPSPRSSLSLWKSNKLPTNEARNSAALLDEPFAFHRGFEHPSRKSPPFSRS